MKNYIGFVNDHSGSMSSHRGAAIKDYNAQITAIKDAASREMLDTVVSVVGCGLGKDGKEFSRQVTVSNPHVLKPVDSWPCPGSTPLWDSIADIVHLMGAMPDATNEDVSFLVIITTDGEENGSREYTEQRLRLLIDNCQSTGRWTFVMRMPKNSNRARIERLGIPRDNIQLWDTTRATGMTETTQANTAAMSNYFSARSAGARSSSAFYSDASNVNLAALEDVSPKISLYVVPQEDNGIEIRPFILRHRMEHLKGSAFYQLTKTEPRVQHDKQVVIRDRQTGKMFAGKDARKMIGLPDGQNARLHPGDHQNYDIFIQSNSVNRKLVGGTGVLYWKDIGVPFTVADLAYLQPKPTPAPGPVVLPQVPVSSKPTKSLIPVTKRPVPAVYFATREEARRYCGANGVPQSAILNRGRGVPGARRWEVPASA